MPSARILVVYEGLPVLTLIAGALESQGYQVTVAPKPRNAVGALAEKTFDLVILKWSGEPQLAALLLKLKPPTKLLVLSEAWNLPQRLAQVEVAGFILLPCRPVQLKRRIAEYLKSPQGLVASPRSDIQLHPVNHRVYQRLLTIFNEMAVSVLGLASQMELLRQRAKNRNDQELAALCQQACQRNQILWEIMRDMRGSVLRLKSRANPETPSSPQTEPFDPYREL